MKKGLLTKILTLILVAGLSVSAGVAGTLAYLKDEANDLNVMTLGNVDIEQHEHQRAVKDGVFETKTIDGVTSYVLEEFKNDKPLFPSAINTETWNGWDWDSTVVRMTQVDSYGSMQVFLEASNAQDKFVTVENTGKTDAYIRTFVAIEVGEASPSLIGTSYHQTWSESTIGLIVVDGINYYVNEYVYKGGQLSDGTWRHENGILPAGDTSYPNLSQVYIHSKATNEDMDAIDGNKNGKLDILVLSQAIQAEGFETAEKAFAEGFPMGDSNINLASWFGGVIAEHSVDVWDGTSDTTWYNDTDTEFTLTTAEQLAGLGELVDGGNNFAGKTIKLAKDFDLYYLPDGTTEPKSFDPIGDKSAFAGTFDGQGHTIENLYQSGWAFGYEWGSYGSVGLFGELESATVKNLTISGAESLVEGGDVGGITGSATGDCVFENITLKDSVFATYNNGNGGIIGWSGAGTYTFKNITIGEDVVLAGLWGSFDSSIGGVVGQGEPGATYNFENVDIKCRLDVYNDCTASYDYYNYRMCGMIIGRLDQTTTIDGVNYPDTSKYNINCKDVTVTYGNWMNYHYCEPTPGYNNGRGMRVEAGYSYDGLPADYDHSQCVDNHMNLIPFDQIFGGDQLGVKGLKTYDGVTVVYPN